MCLMSKNLSIYFSNISVYISVQEFEKFPQCRHLKLSHYFLKPIQRLPQYKLLLEDYLRNLDPNSLDYDDTATALTIVTQAAHHANETIKQTVGVKFLEIVFY